MQREAREGTFLASVIRELLGSDVVPDPSTFMQAHIGQKLGPGEIACCWHD